MPEPPDRLSILTVLPDKKVTLLDLWRVSAICSAAQILRRVIMPLPAFSIASLTSLADSAEPCDLMAFALASSCSFQTLNFFISATCWATCLASTLWTYSLENYMSVIDTSSSMIENSANLLVSPSLISIDTFSLCVISCSAAYLEMIDLTSSPMIEGKTRESQSSPRLLSMIGREASSGLQSTLVAVFTT